MEVSQKLNDSISNANTYLAIQSHITSIGPAAAGDYAIYLRLRDLCVGRRFPPPSSSVTFVRNYFYPLTNHNRSKPVRYTGYLTALGRPSHHRRCCVVVHRSPAGRVVGRGSGDPAGDLGHTGVGAGPVLHPVEVLGTISRQ